MFFKPHKWENLCVVAMIYNTIMFQRLQASDGNAFYIFIHVSPFLFFYSLNDDYYYY